MAKLPLSRTEGQLMFFLRLELRLKFLRFSLKVPAFFSCDSILIFARFYPYPKKYHRNLVVVSKVWIPSNLFVPRLDAE